MNIIITPETITEASLGQVKLVTQHTKTIDDTKATYKIAADFDQAFINQVAELAHTTMVRRVQAKRIDPIFTEVGDLVKLEGETFEYNFVEEYARKRQVGAGDPETKLITNIKKKEDQDEALQAHLQRLTEVFGEERVEALLKGAN